MFKKLFIVAVIIGFFVFYGYKKGFRTLFSPVRLERIQSDSIQKLLRKIQIDEKAYAEGSTTADTLAQSYVKLGKKYLENKNWTPAIDAYEKAISYGDNGARVHHGLGMAYANRGQALKKREDTQKAKHHYNQAIQINPEMHDARYGLGMVYYLIEEDYDRAISQMRKIVEMEPKYFQARFALGRILYESGRKKAALIVYENFAKDLRDEHQSTRIVGYREKVEENITRILSEPLDK